MFNRKAAAAQKQMSPELVAEKAVVAKLYNPVHKGQGQSAEYIAAAKALNEKLRAAGLTTLLVVEA